MRCAICDADDDTITFDRKTGTFSDCRACQSVIQDTLEHFEDHSEVLEPNDDEAGDLHVASG